MRLSQTIVRRIQVRFPRMTFEQQCAASKAIFALLIFEENKEAFHQSDAMQQEFARDLNALTKALS